MQEVPIEFVQLSFNGQTPEWELLHNPKRGKSRCPLLIQYFDHCTTLVGHAQLLAALPGGKASVPMAQFLLCKQHRHRWLASGRRADRHRIAPVLNHSSYLRLRVHTPWI